AGALERATGRARVAPQAALSALVESAEAMAATDDAGGPERLWAFEEGDALAAHLTELIGALAHLLPMPPDAVPALLDAALKGVVVRGRRAVRGAGEGALEHPRVFIWGLLEARLQTVELIVLGGLSEGSWPPATDPGPWLSRPMRAVLGLPAPEEAVGRAAHDFLAAALAAAEVVFSAPRRRDGAPAVPARWLMRLAAMLGRELPRHPAVLWARALDRPAGAPHPVSAPRPKPPVAARPRRLAVTEIATWLADPYAIYARHVLRLRPLPGIAEAADAADFGQIVHAGLARFFASVAGVWPADAAKGLGQSLCDALEEHCLPPHLAHWWQPRLARIAAWVDGEERLRRAGAAAPLIAVERGGEWKLSGPAGPFILAGRADRIERRGDGRIGILDYKTGRIPVAADVFAGRAPQLPLLAAMAEAGALGAEFAAPVAELTYWRLLGRDAAGEAGLLTRPEQIPALKDAAVAGLMGLIAAFDEPARPYLAQPHPGNLPSYSDYARLARVAEWASGGV
ncbi:MAG: PD-(D/E)XK nuclease family protein, partial [Acetobacteraceae bacterium]